MTNRAYLKHLVIVGLLLTLFSLEAFAQAYLPREYLIEDEELPGKYSLVVKGEPRDAAIIIQPLNIFYLHGIRLSPNTYTLDISKEGYAPITKSVTIVDHDVTVEYALQPKSSQQYSLTVEVEPKDATIKILYIEPKYQPGILLESKEYKLEISRDGYKTIYPAVTVDRDVVVRYTLQIQPKPVRESSPGVLSNASQTRYEELYPEAFLKLKSGDDLQLAVQASPSASLLVLAEGTYEVPSTWQINKEMHFVGKGADLVTIRLGDGLHVLQTNAVWFEGIRFHLTDFGGNPVILSSGSALKLENCIVTGSKLSGLEVNGGSVDAVHNEFVDNGQNGVMLLLEAKGYFRDNKVRSNGLNGIEVRDGSLVKMESNVLRQNKQAGIFVFNGGSGSFVHNLIDENELGFVVHNGKELAVKENCFSKNRQAGLHVTASSGVFEKNAFIKNGGPDIQVENSPEAVFSKNNVEGEVSGLTSH